RNASAAARTTMSWVNSSCATESTTSAGGTRPCIQRSTPRRVPSGRTSSSRESCAIARPFPDRPRSPLLPTRIVRAGDPGIKGAGRGGRGPRSRKIGDGAGYGRRRGAVGMGSVSRVWGRLARVGAWVVVLGPLAAVGLAAVVDRGPGGVAVTPFHLALTALD